MRLARKVFSALGAVAIFAIVMAEASCAQIVRTDPVIVVDPGSHTDEITRIAASTGVHSL